MNSEVLLGFAEEWRLVAVNDASARAECDERADVMAAAAERLRRIEERLAKLPKGLFSGTATQRLERRCLNDEAERVEQTALAVLAAGIVSSYSGEEE